MSSILSLTGQPPKLFEVAYFVEQGYALSVQADTADAAKRIVRQRLEEEADVLDGSRRVHHSHGITGVEEVRP